MVKTSEPFLCIITPVFDGGLNSLKLFVKDLKLQTYGNFIQISVSNGASPHCKEFIESQKDSRFFYCETPFEETSDAKTMLKNLGERRNYCFARFNALRYACFDVDLKIIDPNFFQLLKDNHYKAAVIIHHGIIFTSKQAASLPKFPLGPGRIDLANFTLAKSVISEHQYPLDYHPIIRLANDWRFFSSFKDKYSTKILKIKPIVIAGNCTYERVTAKYIDK